MCTHVKVHVSLFFSGGTEEIKNHIFFANIDWDALYKKEIKPPFKPAIKDDDAFYFDSEFTCKTPKGDLKKEKKTSRLDTCKLIIIKSAVKCLYKRNSRVFSDSPGVPPSANAHELFRGFSFVAPGLLADVDHAKSPDFRNYGSISATFPSYVNSTSITDEYEFKHEIGRGGYSVVYLAVHISTKTEYAVKVSFDLENIKNKNKQVET